MMKPLPEFKDPKHIKCFTEAPVKILYKNDLFCKLLNAKLQDRAEDVKGDIEIKVSVDDWYIDTTVNLHTGIWNVAR